MNPARQQHLKANMHAKASPVMLQPVTLVTSITDHERQSMPMFTENKTTSLQHNFTATINHHANV
jgi:uncharacterized protein YbcC (UPF0753/DUF2309 family)